MSDTARKNNDVDALPPRSPVAEGVAKRERAVKTGTRLTRRERVERDIVDTLRRIEGLARAGQNPGFPLEFEHRLMTATHAFRASHDDLPVHRLKHTRSRLQRLAYEARSVKMLEGVS